MEQPSEIENIIKIFESLPGVTEVECYPTPLEEFNMQHLSLVPYGDLPHASLIRTEGGLKEEALGQIFFRLEPSLASWRTLEFLSWQVRDCSRSGISVQIRSLGLPPRCGDQIQLGTTLRFVIDLFASGLEGDSKSLLKMMDEFASNLQDSIEVYDLDWRTDSIKRR